MRVVTVAAATAHDTIDAITGAGWLLLTDHCGYSGWSLDATTGRQPNGDPPRLERGGSLDVADFLTCVAGHVPHATTCKHQLHVVIPALSRLDGHADHLSRMVTARPP